MLSVASLACPVSPSVTVKLSEKGHGRTDSWSDCGSLCSCLLPAKKTGSWAICFAEVSEFLHPAQIAGIYLFSGSYLGITQVFDWSNGHIG